MLPAVTDVLEFLYSLYEQELSYSTINTARSALTSYLMNTNLRDAPYTVSTHPFINRFMKGVFNSRKPTPKYSETWDVNIVLGFIKRWYQLNTLSLKDLTYKLVILLALTTGQRRQVLVSLDTQTMTKTNEYYVFHLNDHVKQNRPGYVFSTVFVSLQCFMCVSNIRALFGPNCRNMT